MDSGNERPTRRRHSIMSKDHDRLALRPPDVRSVSATLRKTKRPRSRTSSTGDKETATGRKRVSSSRKVPQDLTVLTPTMGRIAAQAFRHIRIERFRAVLADAQQLVRKYPTQAMLIGVGLGYLLSRAKGDSDDTTAGHRTIRG